MTPLAALPPPPSDVTLHAGAFTRIRAPHGWTTHVVRPGETLFGIALRHRTSTSALVAKNGLANGGRILLPGDQLKVPRTGAAHHRSGRHRAEQRRVHKRPARQVRLVLVRRGDTVSGLALRYHTSWAAILKANGMSDPRSLQAGQRVRVPAGSHLAGSAPRHRSGQQGKRPVQHPSNTFAGRTYPDAVVRSAAANRRWLARHAAPSRSQVRALIVSTARRHGVDPRLALAVGYLESGWNQRAVSVANAIGTMQVIPSTGRWASQLSGRHLNLLRAQDNVTAGVVLLRSLTRSADDERQAIAGYYQGLAGVRQHGMYPDTRRYVRNVLSLKSRM